jgi:lipoyl(octanoyl) transferase
VKPLSCIPLTHLDYATAYEQQTRLHTQILDARKTPNAQLGQVMMVEHDPVITVTRRPDAQSHVLASQSLLESQGVTLHQTDRGGDVTYHGPGQLVSYPIIDLNVAKLRIHDYIRLLEQAVINTLATYNITGSTDPDATGVWIDPKLNPQHRFENNNPAKICAIGVRVRKWITLHGLAINLNPNMEHYELIVPCGLTNRPVTSIAKILGSPASPTLPQLASKLFEQLELCISNKHAHTQHQAP